MSKPVSAPPNRTSGAPSTLADRPPCVVHPTAVVADKAQLSGSHAVEIGENVILHPYTKITADGGKVTIGKNSIISERTIIGSDQNDVVLGQGVDVHTGVVVEAQSVGDWSTIEVNAKVGKGAMVGKWCKVAALEQVKAGEVLQDYTVVFGDGLRRVDKTAQEREEVRKARIEGREKEVELLKKLIPNAAYKWR